MKISQEEISGYTRRKLKKKNAVVVFDFDKYLLNSKAWKKPTSQALQCCY